eukprot:4119380-Alexandrium_andersonii.AAC.1
MHNVRDTDTDTRCLHELGNTCTMQRWALLAQAHACFLGAGQLDAVPLVTSNACDHALVVRRLFVADDLAPE